MCISLFCIIETIDKSMTKLSYTHKTETLATDLETILLSTTFNPSSSNYMMKRVFAFAPFINDVHCGVSNFQSNSGLENLFKKDKSIDNLINQPLDRFVMYNYTANRISEKHMFFEYNNNILNILNHFTNHKKDGEKEYYVQLVQRISYLLI